MAYCDSREVREMIKDEALNSIIGDRYIEDSAERESLAAPLIAAAVEDAEGEIDGYLAKRYSVPLSPVPKVINKFCKDIALYNLISRIGIDEGSEEKNYLNRYHAAVKFLTLLADGKVSIGGESGGGQEAAVGSFSLSSQERLFRRDSLQGM